MPVVIFLSKMPNGCCCALYCCLTPLKMNLQRQLFLWAHQFHISKTLQNYHLRFNMVLLKQFKTILCTLSMSRPLRQTCGVGELGPKMQAAEMRVSLFMKWNTDRNGKGVDRNYTKLKLEKAKDYKKDKD